SQGIAGAGGGTGAGEGLGIGRELHRGRHASGSLGQREEFPAQGEEEFASAGRSGKSHGEFSWGEALERNARIEKRSRRDAGAQKCRQGGQVELQRQSAGGESPWI